jgi:methylated-DNA-[protein]-cysteine S-methyltransferase
VPRSRLLPAPETVGTRSYHAGEEEHADEEDVITSTAAGLTVAAATLGTPIGPVTVACSPAGVCWVAIGRRPGDREGVVGGLRVVDDPARVEAARTQMGEYFAGHRRFFDLPVDWRHASRLQRQVLGVLHESVRYGQTVTYGELADRSGTGIPARAVGSVMAANPIPIIVPCHRVVAADGLGGFSGGAGIEVKRWLLTLEGAVPPTLDWAIDAGLPGG